MLRICNKNKSGNILLSVIAVIISIVGTICVPVITWHFDRQKSIEMQENVRLETLAVFLNDLSRISEAAYYLNFACRNSQIEFSKAIDTLNSNGGKLSSADVVKLAEVLSVQMDFQYSKKLHDSDLNFIFTQDPELGRYIQELFECYDKASKFVEYYNEYVQTLAKDLSGIKTDKDLFVFVRKRIIGSSMRITQIERALDSFLNAFQYIAVQFPKYNEKYYNNSLKIPTKNGRLAVDWIWGHVTDKQLSYLFHQSHFNSKKQLEFLVPIIKDKPMLPKLNFALSCAYLFTRNYERCQFYANKFLSIRTDNEIVYLDDDFKRGVIKFINENYCESERRELLLLYNAIFKMTNVDDKLTDYEKRFMFDDISK